MLKKRGFTLIELLIVISIIGILAGIVMIPAPKLINKSRDAQTKEVLSAIRSAVNSYWMVHDGKYPSNLEELSPDYIKKTPLNWRGSVFSGVFLYNSKKGTVQLADKNGKINNLPKDAQGLNYSDY